MLSETDSELVSKSDVEASAANEIKKDGNSSRDEDLDSEEIRLRGWQLAIVQFILLFGLVLSVMDSSIVATALIEIGHYFDDFVRLQWVVLAYLLAYLGFALISSRLSDVIGRKWTTILALVILTTMSLGCGLSQTLNQLIAFRVVQGFAGSALYSMAMTALPEITPREKLPVFGAVMGMAFAVSGVLGPVIGGVITTHSTWRWCFLFNAPCGGFLIVMSLIFWPNIRTAGRISWKEMDLIGCLFYMAASVLLVFALQEAGSGVYEWSSATTIACLIVAGASAIAFGVWISFLSRRKHAIAPLVPGRIFLNRVIMIDIVLVFLFTLMSLTNLLIQIRVSTLIGYIFYTLLIELPERFQILNGKSPQSAGISLLPLSGASAVGSAFGGVLSSKRNYTFYGLVGACAFMLLGSGLFFTIGNDKSIQPSLYGFEVLLGLGIGSGLASATVIIKLNADDVDSAPTQGLLSQSRVLGGNIGLAIASLVLSSHFNNDLRDVLSPSQISDLKKSLNILETFDPVQQEAVALSFGNAFHKQMEICTYVAAAALLLSLCGWQRNPPQGFNEGPKVEGSQEEVGKSDEATVTSKGTIEIEEDRKT